jgi:hypothetical protein
VRLPSGSGGVTLLATLLFSAITCTCYHLHCSPDRPSLAPPLSLLATLLFFAAAASPDARISAPPFDASRRSAGPIAHTSDFHTLSPISSSRSLG